jgi:uncharacterized coiled-coil protein SlyX
MSDEERRDLPVTTEQPKTRSELGDAWREVGEQVQQLGAKLAAALRQSWAATTKEEDEEHEETMRRLRDDLRAAADRVENVLGQVKEQTTEERAAAMKATRKASSMSLDEARVLTASTLRKLNEQLDRLAERLEKERDRQTTDAEAAADAAPGEEREDRPQV